MPRDTDIKKSKWTETVLSSITPDGGKGPSRGSIEMVESLTGTGFAEEDDEEQQAKPHWLIDSLFFNGTVYTVIVLNSVQIGLAVDHPNLDGVWNLFDHAFSFFFLIEMILKLIFMRCKYFSSGWNRMDCLLVSLSIFDIWVAPNLDRFGISADASERMGDSSALRILRILRVARVARLLKVFKELWMIVQGIWNSLSALFWVICLLTLVVYTSSILCVNVIGASTRYPGRSEDFDEIMEWQEFNNFQYFGNMRRSMYTLFNLVMLTEVDVVGRPLYERQPFMLLFFVLFAIFTSLGVLNVIIGIIVENTMDCAKKMEQDAQDSLKASRLKLLSKILNLVMELDTDKNDEVTIRELEAGWGSDKFKELIERINLPNGWAPLDFMHLLDHNGDGTLASGEFMKVFYQLLTDDQFQQMCILHGSVNQVKGMILTLGADLAKQINVISENAAKEAPVPVADIQTRSSPIPCEMNSGEEIASESFSIEQTLRDIKNELGSLRTELAASQQKQDEFQRQQEAFREDIRLLSSKAKEKKSFDFMLPGSLGSSTSYYQSQVHV
jgi:voltage-gated sodium channel